jgi:tetratricopeptide (TPR) repeat protein
MKRLIPVSIALLGSLLLPADAHALSCDEIMNMVDVNVPTNIVVQTMKDSGDQFSPDELRCLSDKGAPSEVVAQARAMLSRAEPDEGPGDDSTPARSMDDDSDAIGTRRNSSDDLPEAGGPDSSSDPEDIKEAVKLLQAKKPLTASLRLFEILEDGNFPGEETKLHYYLGRALSDLEMYHTAQYHYMQVVKQGPSDPYFNYALPKLVAIARITGDDTEIARIAKKLDPADFPRGAKNQLYYLKGVYAYSKDDLASSREYFGQVSSKSSLYLNARYFEGVIFNEQGKLKSAVRAFRDVYREDVEVYNDPQELESVEQLKDLALINIARVYYGIERFDEADKYYSLVSRDSIYWPEALFERSWTTFMRNDLNTALGLVLTVNSPFYSEEQFVPEATILRALTFFNLCEYTDVENMLISFEGSYGPMRDEMRDFVQGYATEEGRKLSDQAWNTYFGRERDIESTLPQALFARILRHSDLSGIVKHLEMMDSETELIEAQKSRWQETIGVYLKKIIESDRQRYERRAGRLFLSEMARQANYLSDLMTQSEIIRFEVVDAQRVDYSYKAENTELLDTSLDDLDFATSVDFIYWPFNGEFWEDELGYYHYTEQGACQ